MCSWFLKTQFLYVFLHNGLAYDIQINTPLEIYLNTWADSFLLLLKKEILVLLVSTLLVYFHVSFNCFLVSKLQIGLQYFHKVYIHCCSSSWMWFLKHVDPSKISRKQWFLNLACIIITWKATCWGSVPRVPGLLGLGWDPPNHLHF